ncbi:MAG: anion transporter [Chloroflexi bacterium]|nr:anion transporter [Chloroflexota bacterium]
MLALAIFIVTYIGVAFTRLPWVRVDRPSAAFLGGVAMVLFGVLTPEQAVESIDWGTIALLLGMMVLVAALSRDGHVTRVAAVVFGGARSRGAFLARVVIVTGVASALLVNDTAVLVLTPLILAFCVSKRLPPAPFLIAAAMASNIGSVPSVVGNPQNVLVALQSGISFERFALHLLPVAVVSTLVLIGVIRWLYRGEMTEPMPQALDSPAVAADPPKQRPSRLLSPVVMALVIVGFVTSTWTGLELPLIALVGAGVVLLAGSQSPGELLRGVDWVLLLFFASLFVVMGGISRQEFFIDFVNGLTLNPDAEGVALTHGAALAISQAISNVPFTILMLPLLSKEGSDLLWLSLASGATLAGNLTLIGAVANLIVAQLAERDGVRLDFWEFAKAGAIVTLVTVGLSILLLWAQMALGWLS